MNAKTNSNAKNITATINGVVFENLTIEQAAQLANMASTVTNGASASASNAVTKAEAKAKKHAKGRAKVENERAKHDAILNTKRVERMTETALAKFAAAGIEVKSSKQGKWVWVYPCGKSAGKGREPEFKDVKLPKGWNHSMKRGAFFRDFS